MDLKNGYSSERILKIIQDRCRYVIERGSTLNNPHIPGSYFESFDKIKPGDKAHFLKLVKAEL